MTRKRIGVLTSGGDCPGLNAAIRAVVRCGLNAGFRVFGFRRGFKGLMDDEIVQLDSTSVSGIIKHGGTMLLASRSEEFQTPSGMRKATTALKKNNISGLIVIGGNGSLRGAWELSRKTKTAIIGVPKSIDNDIGGTDFSIGFDTAVNTAVSVIDKIRDTATSHERLFLVEVMGRKCGWIALAAGLASGAEEIILPETPTDIGAICARLNAGINRGKRSSIIIVAEGDEAGGAFEIAKKIRERSGYDPKVSVIGYQQRGGAPSAFDRILASCLGKAAVDALKAGMRGKVVGIIKGEAAISDLAVAWQKEPVIKQDLIALSRILT